MPSYKSKMFNAPQTTPGDGCAVFYDDAVALTALALNDTCEFPVPGGTRVSLLELQLDDIDSNASPLVAWSVGYRPVNPESTLAANLTYFGTGIQAGRAAGRTSLSFKPITFNEPVAIVMTATAAPATFQAGEVCAVVGGNSVGMR